MFKVLEKLPFRHFDQFWDLRSSYPKGINCSQMKQVYLKEGQFFKLICVARMHSALLWMGIGICRYGWEPEKKYRLYVISRLKDIVPLYRGHGNFKGRNHTRTTFFLKFVKIY